MGSIQLALLEGRGSALRTGIGEVRCGSGRRIADSGEMLFLPLAPVAKNCALSDPERPREIGRGILLGGGLWLARLCIGESPTSLLSSSSDPGRGIVRLSGEGLGLALGPRGRRFGSKGKARAAVSAACGSTVVAVTSAQSYESEGILSDVGDCHSDLGLFKKSKTCEARRTGSNGPVNSSSSLLGVGEVSRSAGRKELPKLRSPSDPASTCSELLGYMSSVESYDSTSESGGGREECIDEGVSWTLRAGDLPGTLIVSSCPFGGGVSYCWTVGLVLVDQDRVSFLVRLCLRRLSAHLGSDLAPRLGSPGGVLENAEGLSEPSGAHMLSRDATDGSFRSLSIAGVIGLRVLALVDLQLDVLL